ncbi:hypothetical protein [Acidipropionibacterium acidipropionici]|uniref:hypothetical protein n=1 Tax=Acidipropionibacterium acidipropionici TaxID=1748 RepID=UPI00110B81CC|nr:hypothetical protein [Acidipropionibacterium acidipropionici]QCV94320.1 hypothetical protein FEZ30_02725 [Acidipropionibacterium acidipropionici]
MATKTKTDPELQALLDEHGTYIPRSVAGKIAGCSAKTMCRLTTSGELPLYAIGRTRTLRVKTADVYRLIHRVA